MATAPTRPLSDEEVFAPVGGAARPLTDEELFAPVVAPAAAPAAAKGNGLDAASQFGAGLSDIGRGFNSTVRQTVGSERAPAEAPDTGPNAVGNVVEGVRNLDYGKVRDNVGPALARIAPDVVGGLGAAGAGFMVGGPVGALVGGGLYAAGRSHGENVEARARKNHEIGPDGNHTPSTSSHVVGGLTTAAGAAFDAVGSAGLGTTRRALSSAAAPVERGFVARTGAALRDTATEGATGAVSDSIQQVGTSAGTADGLSYDPVQAAVGGVLESGVRGATALPGAALRGSAETAARIGGENAMGDMTTDRAGSVERVMATVDRLRNASDGQNRPLEDHINTAREEVKAEVHSLLERGRDLGFYDDQEYRAQAALFRTAADHNKVLSNGEAETDSNNAFGLARVDKLSAPPEFKAQLKDHLLDLDTIATAARKKNLTGSFEKFGDIAGRIAGVVGGGVAGGLPGAIAGGAAAMVANPLHARIGAYVGRKIDGALGTRSPAIALARGKAQEILAKAGKEDVGDTLTGLKKTNDILNDPALAARYAMNLPVDVVSLSRSALQKAKARVSAGLEPKPDQFDAMTPDHRAEMQEWLGFRSEVEAKAKAAADAKSAEKSANLTERAADRISGIAYKMEKRQAAAEAKASARQQFEDAAASRAAEAQTDAVGAAQRRAALGGALSAPQASPQASPLASPAAPPGVGIAPEVPPAPYVVPPPGGDYGKKALPGWAAGVRSFVQTKGVKAPNREQIMQAVDDLETVGHFDSDEAAAIRAAPQRIDREWQQAITARVGELMGAPDLHDRPDVVFTQGAPNASYWNGIAKPAAWESARDARQSYIDQAIEMNREVDPPLGETLGMFKLLTDAQMAPAAKVVIAQATIAGTTDPATKARREAVLKPLIALYKKD